MLTPPSPSSSPTLTTRDVNISRKRQRSLSMDSEPSSSSPKRSASQDPGQEGIRGQHSRDISAPRISDNNVDEEIDSYMAEQGEASIPQTLQIQSTPGQLNGIAASVSPTERLATIESLRKTPMSAGDTWYIVSRGWYRRWHKACSGEVDKEGVVEEKDLGPVDNSPLVDNSGNLISTAIEHVDVEFVPEQAWSLFVSWYGQPRYPLPRKVITRGIIQETGLELHPLHLKVHLLAGTLSGDPEREPFDVTVSIKDSVKDISKAIMNAVDLQFLPSQPLASRIWKVAEGGSSSSFWYTIAQLKENGATLLGESDKTVEEELIESGDAFVIEPYLRDEWMVDPSEVPAQKSGTSCPTPSAQKLTPPPLFNSGTDFFSKLQTAATPLAPPNPVGSSALRPAASIKASPSANTRSKAPRQAPGTLGLGNMGNTCFMNSAIQCLAHLRELVDYFLTGVFEEELNPDNPLGMHGAVAEAFGALLHRIWVPTSSASSYSPREFKQVLQRFAPQFGGYQQHDSQELVAFLLDGLHEDLNRVLKKPYVEKPDWEGGGDKELAALAKESWDGYMKRNDSVIVDLFQGQYQSTLVCPECEKVSITFDPFMYLTLPLPIQKKWKHDIYYIPWDLNKPHVKVPVEINRDASFKELRQLLARWMDANPDNLLTLEIFNHRFYKSLDDTTLCGDMSDGDVIVCFELPCHAQQSRTYKKQENDPFIMPVFLCDAQSRQSYSTYNNTVGALFGYPFIVVLDEDQASDEQQIYGAIIDRLQRWTANASHLYTWEPGSPSEPMEEVPIPISGIPTINAVTEIKENGDIVTIEEDIPEESDIVDEKGIVIQEPDMDAMDTTDYVPRKVGYKKEIFRLRLQTGSSAYGIGYGAFTNGGQRDVWEQRRLVAATSPVLLREGDLFFCEFDENMKAFYFGDAASHWEHARWNVWEEFIHPELVASRDAASSRTKRGITLQDCLDEFTKEEKLGEDDLWYCPRCKKHQQATKRFDLWKVPDVLVVHLKRFSNSRTLRDKIDTLVDFPLEGLDLSEMVGERQVTKRLSEAGTDVEALGLSTSGEPLVYDLFAVDEHMGGLGGGHYRAYAHNDVTQTWYHFDDSYVTPSRPEAAVNPNAYLLFYRRRTSQSIGGKSVIKIEAARKNAKHAQVAEEIKAEPSQLPTPPPETRSNDASVSTLHDSKWRHYGDSWQSTSHPRSSPASTPPPLEEPDPPTFEDAQFDEVVQSSLDPLTLSAHQFDFPDPTSRASPTSSNEVEPDLDQDNDSSSGQVNWENVLTNSNLGLSRADFRTGSPAGSIPSDSMNQATDDDGEADFSKAHSHSDQSDIDV